MKIYQIIHFNFGWEYNMGHVIVANNEEEVISMAKAIASDEGTLVWDSADISIEGEYSGINTQPFIMMSDHNGA